MQYLSQNELKKMMLASYKKIEKHKEEINKINIFPVPDQDTGGNLAKTLEGIKERIENKEFKDLATLSETILDGALTAAQGNAGVIYTGFLAGFLPSFQNRNPLGAKKIAKALKEGTKRARDSIQEPKEGTILDVIDSCAKTFQEEAEEESDIIKILKKAIEKAKKALLATKGKLEVLRRANLVDAGGLGFLIILEGFLEALEGEEKGKREEGKILGDERRFWQVLSHRFEIISLIQNPRLSEKEVRERLKKLGNCLDIVKVGNKMKIHIHTDDPDEVKNILKSTGEIQRFQEQDMAKEIAGEESVKKVSIGIVTDNVAMIPSKIKEHYQIEIVDLKYDWPDEKNLPGKNIYQKLREAEKRGIKPTLKTSQAAPGDYSEAFKRQLNRFDKVLCIVLTSKLSGSYNSAIQARKMLKEKGERIYIFDSSNAAAGQALLVLKAIELLQEQRGINEILEELKRLISKVHLYVIFEDPRWIESIGRITESQANWIRGMKKIRLQPIMELKNGTIAKGGIVFAKEPAEALFKKIFQTSKKERKEGKAIRVIIGHADNLFEAQKLKKLLKEKINAEIPYISLGPPLICAAAGPGTLIAGWMAI